MTKLSAYSLFFEGVLSLNISNTSDSLRHICAEIFFGDPTQDQSRMPSHAQIEKKKFSDVSTTVSQKIHFL